MVGTVAAAPRIVQMDSSVLGAWSGPSEQAAAGRSRVDQVTGEVRLAHRPGENTSVIRRDRMPVLEPARMRRFRERR